MGWLKVLVSSKAPSFVLSCQMEYVFPVELHASWPSFKSPTVTYTFMGWKCSELKEGQTGTIKDALLQGIWCVLLHNTMSDRSHHPLHFPFTHYRLHLHTFSSYLHTFANYLCFWSSSCRIKSLKTSLSVLTERSACSFKSCHASLLCAQGIIIKKT